ncbi:MAG: hypothetical protein BWY42_00946 [Candidatus Omnitrophica bacterium ADurb.Bin277]|nr:MAG: hypothetical protein BWY42_00946 [Candidatus Omnitrophica bacterium ADurb.Bin277]
MPNNFIFRRDEIEAFQIKESEMRAATKKDQERRTEMAERKNILRDNIREIILAQLARMFTPQTYEDMRFYVDATNNIMRRVCRELSSVYTQEPERVITPKSAQKRYEQITQLNEKMARANFLVNGMNDAIIQITTMGGVIDLNILTPDMVTVFENKDNPTVLDAILIEDSYYNDASQIERQWIYWSPTRHFILDKDYRKRPIAGNPEMLNPYAEQNILQNSFYPFVPVHASDRENGFWDRYSGRDLVDATKLVAIQSTFRNFMVPMQFKQLSVKTQGVDERQGTTKSNQIKSPLDILTTNGDAQVLDWQSNLQQIGEQIQNQIFAIATNYGISAENFKLTAQAVSGFARKVARERLDEIREEQIKVWRRAEEQVFEAIKWATIVYDLDPIPEAAKISIDFAKPKEFEDPQIEIDIKKQKVDLGVISLLDIVKEENPDVKTDDQAEELLRKNLEIRRRLTSRFGFDFENLLKTRGQQPQGAQNAG